MDELERLMRAARRLWRDAVAWDRIRDVEDAAGVVFSADNPFAAMHGRVVRDIQRLLAQRAGKAA